MQSLSRLILFFLLIASTEAMSQEFLKYQINWGDDSIGLIEAKKEFKENGEVHYIINSSSSFRVILKFHLTFDYFCSFQGDSLIKASAIRKLNGNEKERSWTVAENDAYRIFVDGEELDDPEHSIEYSISAMYFQEPPSENTRIFSERFGQNVPMKKGGSNSYTLSLPNGYSSTYTYDNAGVCKYVEVGTRWADLQFHRIDTINEAN